MKFRCLIIVFTMLLLYACGNESPSDSKVTNKVFHYNQPNNITSLDPAFAKSQNNIWGVDHLFNGLVQLDDDLTVQPCIAKNWSISEDGTTYTFTLRDDVFFHDDEVFENGKGRKVIADDFVYSFERIIDNNLGSPGSWIFKGKVVDNQPFIAKDDQTFVLKLKVPFRPMLGILSMQYCSVIPREAIEKYGRGFRNNPVGTGPFKFKRWLENQALFLEPNPKYFEHKDGIQLPMIDGIRVSFMADRKTAYLELMNGKLDLVNGLESSFVNELLTANGELQPDQTNKLQFLKSPYLNTEYLGINLDYDQADNPLLNKNVRQALNYGFDRTQMLRSLRNNVGKPANSGFTPRGLPSFSAEKVKGYSYQPDKARQLLKAAGYPNGDGIPTINLRTNKDYEDICTFIAKQWEDLGLTVKIDLLESATLREMMVKGQVPFFRGSWIADYPDAESFFTVFYSKNPAPPNYTRFKNAAFDTLYEQALNENDDTKRYDHYQQMDRILIEEAPVIFLWYDETAVFANKEVSGLSKNGINLLKVKEIKK